MNLTNEELRKYPDLGDNVSVEELCRKARVAEEKEDWTQAQLLWEYAMIAGAPHVGTREQMIYLREENVEEIFNEKHEELAYTAVIVPHMEKLMREHLSYSQISEWERITIKPVGWCKEKIEELKAMKNRIDGAGFNSPFGFVVKALLLAACIFGVIMMRTLDVRPEWLDNLNAVFLVVMILVVTVIGGMTFGLWGGIIGFGGTYFLFSGAPELFQYLFKTETLQMGEDYFIQTLYAITALFLVYSLIAAKQENKKALRLVTETKEQYTREAERLYEHLQRCEEVCFVWRRLEICNMKEYFVPVFKKLYQVYDDEYDFFGFHEIKNIDDSFECSESFEPLDTYYMRVKEQVVALLVFSEKYQNVYAKYQEDLKKA